MGHRLRTLLAAGAAEMALAMPLYGQTKANSQPKKTDQAPTCCGQCMMGGKGMGQMRGGKGMKKMDAGTGMNGMQGRMSGGNREDMVTAHMLVMQHEKVKRTVKQLPSGVETLTESDDASVAAKIKEHVPAMYSRLKQNQPIRDFDPLFRELFRYGSKIHSKVTSTPNGVRVVETSADPYVVKLIKAHAQTVDGLVKRGMEAMPEVHQPPKH